MNRLKGKYINLKESTQRMKQLKANLKEIGLEEEYERFEATRGDEKEANNKGLSRGEYGLWKSWLSLLEKETNSHEDYDYLHILEDDAIVTKELKKLKDRINKNQGGFDILFTDMYTNPSVYKALHKRAHSNKSRGTIEIIYDLYTGCTSSCIIDKNKVENVYTKLSSYFNENEKVLPLDNAILRLSNQKILDVASTMPFVTSITVDDISASTIQVYTKLPEPVSITQRFCSILRQELSTIEESERTPRELLDLILKIIEFEEKQEERENQRISLINTICNFADRNEILKYKYHARLKGEKNNPQRNREE